MMAKNVFVTGVSMGIGRAIAEKFLAQGYILFGSYFKHKTEAEELVLQFGEDRVKLIGSYDFRNIDNIKTLLNRLGSFHFDAIVCNSGVFSENDDFNHFNLEEFDRTMNCNFYAPLLLSTGLKENINPGGSIVIISSNDAYVGAFSSISYSVSKSALISLMKCLAVNFGKRNIRVNAVAPGAINTNMNTVEQMEIAPYFTPICRVGSPEEVAKVVYFLSTDEASFVNRETITIDGGYGAVSLLLKCEADQPLSRHIREFINASCEKT